MKFGWLFIFEKIAKNLKGSLIYYAVSKLSALKEFQIEGGKISFFKKNELTCIRRCD